MYTYGLKKMTKWCPIYLCSEGKIVNKQDKTAATTITTKPFFWTPHKVSIFTSKAGFPLDGGTHLVISALRSRLLCFALCTLQFDDLCNVLCHC